MFWTDILSIIRSLNTVFTAIGICHTSYVECLLARSGWNWWTVSLSEICRVLYQNKVEKQCIPLAFIIRIYHDAWSCECQICECQTDLSLFNDTFPLQHWIRNEEGYECCIREGFRMKTPHYFWRYYSHLCLEGR